VIIHCLCSNLLMVVSDKLKILVVVGFKDIGKLMFDGC
jgi:hypothetical protein